MIRQISVLCSDYIKYRFISWLLRSMRRQVTPKAEMVDQGCSERCSEPPRPCSHKRGPKTDGFDPPPNAPAIYAQETVNCGFVKCAEWHSGLRCRPWLPSTAQRNPTRSVQLLGGLRSVGTTGHDLL